MLLLLLWVICALPCLSDSRLLVRRRRKNLVDNTGADCLAALAEGESHAFVHCHREDELALHLRVVTWHDHLPVSRESDRAGHVCGAEEELGTVCVGMKRSVKKNGNGVSTLRPVEEVGRKGNPSGSWSWSYWGREYQN